MFGLPNHHPLSKAVAVLTRDHEHEVDGVVGTEAPLLLMLEQAIGSSTGAGSGGGGKGAILNAAALDLRDSISAQVPGNAPELLLVRLEVHATRCAGDEQAEWDLRKFCESWEKAIRELLQPTRRVPVKDQHCPACGYAQVTMDMDGEDVLRPALEASLTGADSVLRCLVCTEEWRADIWEEVFGASGLPGALPV